MNGICDNCKNLLTGEYPQDDETREYSRCIYGDDLAQWNFIKCTHFNEKPKDNSELDAIADKLVHEGDASRTLCFRMDCKDRDKKKDRPKECMIGRCEKRIKRPESQPTH